KTYVGSISTMSEKRKQYDKQYYLDNKEKKKQYRLNNKEKIKQYNQKYYLNNKEYHKEYQLKNKEKTKQYKKQYELNNREKIRKYQNEKIKRDPNFKLARTIRIRILLALKNGHKSKSSLKLLGCSIEEAWNHLESKFKPGMNKENHGLWHIDHIKPCASFDLTDPEQQAICFHYTNLQPLWAIDNIKKGARYEME
ncbi:MAG: hypothetical protein O3C01_07975, partial [Bacteroidetes bacterium]|nr:hypothetical protein [Bacteroidota bacterium]